MNSALDSEYWAHSAFKRSEKKEQFLRLAGLIGLGDKYSTAGRPQSSWGTRSIKPIPPEAAEGRQAVRQTREKGVSHGYEEKQGNAKPAKKAAPKRQRQKGCAQRRNRAATVGAAPPAKATSYN